MLLHHRLKLEVTVQGAPDGTGLILPYLQLEAVVQQHVIAALDHTHLNTQVPEFTAINPSVENIARVIYDRLEPHLQGKLGSVTVWETPKTSARYSRG